MVQVNVTGVVKQKQEVTIFTIENYLVQDNRFVQQFICD